MKYFLLITVLGSVPISASAHLGPVQTAEEIRGASAVSVARSTMALADATPALGALTLTLQHKR